MKKNLLLLLTVLFSLCTTNAWGAEYTLVTSIDDLSNGDKVIIATKTSNVPSSGVTGGTVQSSTSTKKDATVSSTESSWMQFTVTKTTEGWYLSNASSQYIGKPTDNTFYLTETTNCKGVCSVNSNGVLCCNGRYLQKNSTYYRMYNSINNSYTPFYVWKVTASCTAITPTLTYSPSTLDIGDTSSPTLTGNTGSGTVTYSSDNTSVATVDASTGVVTAVSAGTATITANIAANGDYCSGSATATITVNKKSATVTLSEAGATTSVTGKYVGDSYTLPSTTSQPCGDKTFVGWSTTTITNSATKPTTNYYEPGASVTLAANQTFYAVFATKTTTTGGTTTTEKTITEDFEKQTAGSVYNSTQTYTAANSNAGIAWEMYYGTVSTNAYLSGSKSAQMRWYDSAPSNLPYVQTTAIVKGLKSISFKTLTSDNDYKYSVSYSTDNSTWTNVATSQSVGSTNSTQTKSYTINANGVDAYIKIAITSTNNVSDKATFRIDDVVFTYLETTTGGTTTTYSDYTTQCATETVPSLSASGSSLPFGNVTVNSPKELKFTLSGSNLTADATLALSGTNAGLFSVTPLSVTPTDGSITDQTITVTYTPTATGSHNATLTISSTGAESKIVTLSGTGVAPAAKYTVNFIAGSGTCTTTSLTEASGGAGVTLPTASPSDACKEEGWTFAGWAEASVATKTTTAPATLLAAGNTYNPTANCTLYAVYSHTEAEGEGSSNLVQMSAGNTLSDGDKIVVVANNTNIAMYQETVSTSYVNTWDCSNLSADIVAKDDKNWWTVTIDTVTIDKDGFYLGDDTNGYLNMSSNNLYCNSTKSVWTLLDLEDGTFKLQSNERNLSYRSDLTNNIYWRMGGTSYGTSGQTILNLYKYTSGTTTYYHSTPSCVPTYSITYDFDGGTGSHCANTTVPQGDSYTICDEAPTKEGYTFQGWSDGTSTYAAGATINPTKNTTLTAQWQIKTYTVTWSNNGVTTPVTYEHGDDLTLPSAPASCDGVKEFVGWTADNTFTYHATTPPSDIFTEKTATVTADKTYYAVFATPPGTGGGGGGSETTIGDVLTRETTGITANTTTYSNWDKKTVTSSAIYAGNSAGGNDAIQLRSNNSNSGIVTTASGGKVTHVKVEWQSNTASDRTLDIYGRNVAYEDASDLYDASTRGTKLGSIIYGTSTELEITGDYEYIGLRSNDGAMYLTSVTITWSSAGGSSSYTDYTTICQEVTGIAISGSYPTTFVQYDSFSFAGGIVTATFENGTTQDVTSLATFSGYNMDEVGVQTVTVTYMGQTAKYEITINQSDRWRLTWNVSGKTNTGASPIYVQKGSAIGTLPVPEVPAACAGKTFMGWTTSNIVPSDGKGIVYITEETVPTANTTYYAVFATINNFSTQAAIEDIKSGSKVVIVAVASMDASGGAGQAISSRTISITSQGVIGLSGDEVSIFDETINTPHSTCIWTLTKEGGGIVFEQGGKYIRAVNNGYRRLLLETTKDYWTLSPVGGKDKTYHMQSGNTSHYVEWFDHTDSKYDEGERYIGFVPYTEASDNGDFDMQFYVTANADGNADITDYTTGCAEYTITYYGFHGGYSTSCSSDGTIVLPVNSLHTVPNCGDVVTDHTNLGREFLNVWMTQPHGGHTFKPGDTFILTQDTTLYAQWKMETTSDVTTLPTDIEDLAGTDIYVYGGTTLNIQPGTTTINSLTLKGGLQADGSYKMPTVWVPEGATLERNSNKINLDLIVNAKTYYPFAVPFAAKNNANVEYLDPVLAAASTYGTHFAIKTYDGARRADVGEDKANNWVRVLRDETLQPGVGYIITALTYPDKDTATIRIPMTVPNTWFQNGEQAEVGTTVRNTIAVTAHAGAAATEHQRHAGWNFVANPYLTSFAGGNVANDGGLAYINGELIIQGSYEYTDEEVPYVTVPAYDFAYYSQHKLSDVKLSPEWSFFVQVGTGGTMNFTTAGRQQAPASIAARNAEERPVKMDVDLILSDNHSSDQTGIIICDRYSDAYEIGRDLEKLFGSAYNLSVYTLMEDNTPLAFQALAIRSSMQVIPVGYRAPEQGEYTFRLNEATSSIDLLNEQYEQLVLVDYQTGELTNLLYTDYTFYSERTQSNSRFAIYAVPRQNAPTDLPNAIGSEEEVRKVIYNDHLYILRDGNVYNGMGQKM